MERLLGIDGSHLYLETRREHRHTIKIQIVDAGTAFKEPTLANAKLELAKGLAQIPPMHWRLVRVPFNIAHPLWAYQRSLDTDYHVRRAAVPAPGGPREFAEVVSEIASTGLERDRPLWQVWMVEGLADGRIALVTKIHHALADGGSSARILADAFSESPSEEMGEVPHPWPGDEPIPSRPQLFLEGLRDSAVLSFGLPRFVLRAVRSALAVMRRPGRNARRAVELFATPSTRFNRPLTPHRWFANADLPLAHLQRVKKLLGGTLNDVFVTICAGAIRRYLDERGELPARSLAVSIPVSIRKPEEARSYGNRLSNWLVSLETQEADPVARLRKIRGRTEAAREAHEATDTDLMMDMMDYWWLFRLVDLLALRIPRRLLGRPAFHAIVSNVRGPAKPLYMNGARVTALQSMGPLIDGVGLNFTAWSYVDTLSVGIVACREHVPDVWKLADFLATELAELLEGAEKAAAERLEEKTADG